MKKTQDISDFTTHLGRYVWISIRYHANPLQLTLEQVAVAKSPVCQNYNVKKFRDFMNRLKVLEHNAIIFYQRRKNFFSCPTRNRKSPMSAGVTGSQNFAKVVCWLFTWSAQLCWKVCLFLLLLKTRSRSKDCIRIWT